MNQNILPIFFFVISAMIRFFWWPQNFSNWFICAIRWTRWKIADIEHAKPLGGPASLERKVITCLRLQPHSGSWSPQPIPGNWPSVFYPLHHSPNYLKHNAQNQRCFQNSPVFRTQHQHADKRRKWEWFAGKKILNWWWSKMKLGFWGLAFKMDSYTFPCLY